MIRADPLERVWGDGFSGAAGSLSRMTGLEFSASPPARASASGLHDWLRSNPSGQWLFSQLSGDLFGTMVLLLREGDSKALTLALTGAVAAQGADLGQSALEEAANIVFNAAMSLPSRSLALSVYTTPPACLRGADAGLARSLLPEPVDPNAWGALYRCEFRSTDASVQFFLFLSQDSVGRLRRLVAPEPELKRIEVGIGEMSVAEAPAVLKVTSLGSCLAVVLYNPVKKRGGMAHVLLPLSPSPEKGKNQPGKYADTAVSALLERMSSRGGEVLAWLVGGANMFPKAANTALQIGRGNAEVAQERLKSSGVQRVSADTGGSQGRTAELYTATGEVWVRSGYSPRKLPVPGLAG